MSLFFRPAAQSRKGCFGRTINAARFTMAQLFGLRLDRRVFKAGSKTVSHTTIAWAVLRAPLRQQWLPTPFSSSRKPSSPRAKAIGGIRRS